MAYTKISIPAEGERITTREGKLSVPDHPILLWIEGDGIGPDIVTASKRIWDAAVQMVYGGQRKISWMEIYAGEKAAGLYGGDYFPAESLNAIREFLVGIKGPLTTPVGGGFRSLNVALRKDSRSVRLRPAGPLVPRCAQPAASPRAGGCGDLSREHRGCVCRRRVQGWLA